MIRLLQKLLLFLPIMVLIVGVNYYVDPANIFRSNSYEDGIAQILLHGENVTNISNYDERALQRYYINGLTKAKDIVALGSSRSMGVSSDLFPGKEFFNNSVSGATIEDYIAIYQLYRAKGLLPKTLIIGLDPWLLNKNNDQFRWQSLRIEYEQLIKTISPEKYAFQLDNLFFLKYAELLSFSYFQKSVQLLIENASSMKSRGGNYQAISDVASDQAIKLFDGSLRYDKKTREAGLQEVSKLAIAYTLEEPVYSLRKFNNLDANLINLFESFIDYLISNKVSVFFFFPSYHPTTYKILITSDKYKNIVRAEQYFKAIASKKGIRVFGSYNPEDCLLNEADFYDGMHMKQEAYKKVIGHLF